MKPRTIVTSTHGSKRQRKKAETQADIETQHKLWVIRIQDLVATADLTPTQALVKLEAEVQADIRSRPQWKQALTLTWLEFKRKIDNVKSTTK
jgi:hypothetical protein